MRQPVMSAHTYTERHKDERENQVESEQSSHGEKPTAEQTHSVKRTKAQQSDMRATVREIGMVYTE